MVFLALVLVPAIRQPAYRALAPGLVHVTGVRFRAVGWIALAVLGVSGIGNLWTRGIGMALLADPALLAPFRARFAAEREVSAADALSRSGEKVYRIGAIDRRRAGEPQTIVALPSTSGSPSPASPGSKET